MTTDAKYQQRDAEMTNVKNNLKDSSDHKDMQSLCAHKTGSKIGHK